MKKPQKYAALSYFIPQTIILFLKNKKSQASILQLLTKNTMKNLGLVNLNHNEMNEIIGGGKIGDFIRKIADFVDAVEAFFEQVF